MTNDNQHPPISMTDDLVARLRILDGCQSNVVMRDNTLLEAADEIERLRKDAERLVDACYGMIGLIQLIASRDDLPTGLDDLMLLSHRVTEAKAAINAAIAAAAESPAPPQP